MKRVAVDSSNLASVGYDSNNKLLEVEFNSGSIYEYFNVPEQEHLNLMSAQSHGKYFIANIRNDYRFSRIR